MENPIREGLTRAILGYAEDACQMLPIPDLAALNQLVMDIASGHGVTACCGHHLGLTIDDSPELPEDGDTAEAVEALDRAA